MMKPPDAQRTMACCCRRQPELSAEVIELHGVPLESIPSKALDEYFEMFLSIDSDQSGEVSSKELRSVFQDHRVELSEVPQQHDVHSRKLWR